MIISTKCLSQGFVNLNFENAIINPDSSSIYYPSAIVASNAIPDWTAYINGNPQADIFYNSLSLGAPQVTLENTNSSFSPILEATFSIALQGNSGSGSFSAAIGQTGQIPLSARSLIFWGDVSTASVTFNGQLLNVIRTGNIGSFYGIYTADIFAYAGQIGELLFTAPSHAYAFVDNIQFSNTPVPEPNTLVLAALSGLLLGYRRLKQ